MLPWQARYLLLALIWGASFLFIKLGLQALSPLQVAFARCALGTATLLIILRLSGGRLPRDRTVWGHVFVVALLFNSVPFSLFAYGETHVSSVVAGILNAATPLMTLLVALAALPEERPTTQRVTGLCHPGVLHTVRRGVAERSAHLEPAPRCRRNHRWNRPQPPNGETPTRAERVSLTTSAIGARCVKPGKSDSSHPK